MSERERWIVYPLLFLALGASLRDKLVDTTTTKSIRCQELLIMDEQPLGGEPMLLARLGGIPRVKAEDPYSGQFVLNGQIEIVDRDLSQYQSANHLVTIGRARFGPHGVVGGQVLVKGAINATIYAYQGQPIVPVLRGVFPGASIPAELMQAIPETLAPTHPANKPESAPPTNPTPAPPPSTAPTNSTDDAAQPSQPSAAGEQPPADESSSTVPLDDPVENR